MEDIEYLTTLTNLHESGSITDEVYSNLIQYYAKLMNKGFPVLFNLRHVRKLFNIKKREQARWFSEERNKNYRIFYIPKKSGKWRRIDSPTEKLKEVQLWIKRNILEKVCISLCATGFKKGSSICDNAYPHINRPLIINIDLKDFFPTISYGHVFRVFFHLGYTKEVCHLLTRLCTNAENVLPQGAPTSPILSNIVCDRLDKRLNALAHKVNANYTRYADDITFSGDGYLKRLYPLISQIIESEGFIINANKVRFQMSQEKQSVTGLTVNRKLSVNNRLIKELDNACYFIAKFGVESHMQHINCDRAFYKEHLYGLAYFVHMVDPERGEKYLTKLDKLNFS